MKERKNESVRESKKQWKTWNEKENAIERNNIIEKK